MCTTHDPHNSLDSTNSLEESGLDDWRNGRNMTTCTWGAEIVSAWVISVHSKRSFPHRWENLRVKCKPVPSAVPVSWLYLLPSQTYRSLFHSEIHIRLITMWSSASQLLLAMRVPTESILYLDQLKTKQCIKCTISTAFAFKTTQHCEFYTIWFRAMEIRTAEVNSVEPNPSETRTKQFMNIEVLIHSLAQTTCAF